MKMEHADSHISRQVQRQRTSIHHSYTSNSLSNPTTIISFNQPQPEGAEELISTISNARPSSGRDHEIDPEITPFGHRSSHSSEIAPRKTSVIFQTQSKGPWEGHDITDNCLVSLHDRDGYASGTMSPIYSNPITLSRRATTTELGITYSQRTHSSSSLLSVRGVESASTVTMARRSAPVHFAHKSWPSRFSPPPRPLRQRAGTIPMETPSVITSIQTHTKSTTPSRISDLSTCATLVCSPRDDNQSTHPLATSYYKEQVQRRSWDKQEGQAHRYTQRPVEIISPSNLRDGEKSSWDSDDDDEDDAAISRQSTDGKTYGRFRLLQLKQKFTMGGMSCWIGDYGQMKDGTWQKAVQKGTDSKKKVAKTLRGVFRIKVASPSPS
ncbi:BgTH12-04405 [Blumeria graminis f. sp. triticale]|nr:BgTH12-04405 [Blumeria graminis f. sp. triticale]